MLTRALGWLAALTLGPSTAASELDWPADIQRALGELRRPDVHRGAHRRPDRPAAWHDLRLLRHASQGLLVDLDDRLTDREVEAFQREYRLRLRLNSIHADDENLYLQLQPLPDTADLIPLLERLTHDERVEAVEPNWTYRLVEPLGPSKSVPAPAPQRRLPTKVNDPLYPQQWSFPLIGVPDAWAHADGTGIVVAVIDTGVAFEDYKRFRRVEDLDAARFVEGYDFIRDTSHPNDDHGHGTHVAGTIAQATNNRRGVAGIAPKAAIMPLKVLSRRGSGTAGDIADAIRFAADEGAHIINMSLGGGPRSLIMESAVRYARSKGVLVVCAAGNGSRGRVEYPAAYPGAFAVSSVGPDRKLAYYSSYGPQVAVAAPGGNKKLGESAGILQNTVLPQELDKTDRYLAFQGTSMAAPHVAGVAALVMSTGVRDVARVEAILRETAQDLGPAGRDDRYGAGLVSASAAVESALRARRGPEALVAGWGWAVLALAAGGMLRRRRGLGPVVATVATTGLGVAAGVGLIVGAGPVGVGDVELLRTAGWQSVLPVFAFTIGLVHLKALRPLLFGLAVGFSTALAIQVVTPFADVLGIWGVASVADRAWLLVQACLAGWLAWRVSRLFARS